MLRRLLVYYLRESINIKTALFLMLVILLAVFSKSLVSYDDEGKARLYEPLNISFVDNDDSIISDVIETQFADLQAIGKVHMDTMDRAQERLANNEILLILEMPEDFYEQTTSGESREKVRIWLNEQMPAESNLFARLLNHAVDSFTSVQASLYAYQEELSLIIDDEEVFENYSRNAAWEVAARMISRNELLTVEKEARMRQFWFVVASLSSLFAMLPALLVLMLAQNEIKSGQHRRLLAANVAWWKIHLAKVLIGLLWLVTGLIPVFLALSATLPQLRWYQLFIAIIPLYLSVSFLSLALTFQSNNSEATMLTCWMMILSFLLMGGGIYPTQLLPSWIRAIQRTSPAYYSFTQIYETLYERSVPNRLYVFSAVIIIISFIISGLSWKRSKV